MSEIALLTGPRVHAQQGTAFDEVGKEALDEVLSVFRAAPAMAGKGVQRRSIAFAEPSQCLRSSRGAALRRFQHDAPVRCIKPTMAKGCRLVFLVHGRSDSLFKVNDFYREAKKRFAL